MDSILIEQAFEDAAERARAVEAYEAQPEEIACPLGLPVAEGEAQRAMAEWREYLALSHPAALLAEPDTDALVPEGLRLTELYHEFSGQLAEIQ